MSGLPVFNQVIAYALGADTNKRCMLNPRSLELEGDMSEQIQVQHNRDTHCFSAVVEGYKSVLEYRVVDAKTLDFCHTFVPDELRGKGVAAVLAKAALAYAKEQGCTVIPSCSYIATYLQRHPQ